MQEDIDEEGVPQRSHVGRSVKRKKHEALKYSYRQGIKGYIETL